MRDKEDPDGDLAAGLECPARLPFSELTAAEKKELRRFLHRPRVPAAKGGRLRTLLRGAKKLLQTLAVAAGISVGYVDGNDLDSVGCTVAHQPARSQQRPRSAQSGQRSGTKRRRRAGASAGDDLGVCPRRGGDTAPYQAGRDLAVGHCAYRMPCGLCARCPGRCRLAGAEREGEESGGLVRALTGIRQEIAALRRERAEPRPATEETSDDELRRIYARVLLTAQGEAGWREAPIKEVFDFYCLKGFSAREVAVKLGCSKATVMNRLAVLEKLAGVPAKELRVYKPFFERTEAELRDPRAKRIRRHDAAYGSEPDGAAELD